MALQTRFDRLASVLPDEFGMERVRYTDYLTDRIPEGNVFNLIMYKRKSFEHEEEVCAVKMDDTLDATTMQRLYESPAEDWKVYVSTLDAGSAIPIDITQMVEAVRVSPSSPRWFVKIIQRMVEKSGYSFPVEKSDLDRDPVY